MATTESEQFAALLRELKDRSGRSYGVLAGRLHMSTSTLHRYCNGDAVPNEYAPVERLARLCGASPEESVELHRRWILADEARRRARGTTPSQPPAANAAAAVAATESTPENPPGAAPTEPTEPTPPVDTELPAVGPAVAGKRVRRPGLPGRRLSKRTRLALIGAAVVAVAVPVTALATLSDRPSGSGSGSDTVADAGTSTPLGTRSAARPSASASPGAGASGSPSPSGSSAAPSVPGTPVSKGQKKQAPVEGVPLSVGIGSYDWDGPCGKFFLLDQKPGAVPPPPTNEQDRRAWARALGGVDGGELKLELAATGKSQDAVVITGIDVRVVGRQAPLDWTAYSMGSGCGGVVEPQSFDIDLDAAQPVTKPVAGQQADGKVPARDFPFKVSTSDPEVFDLNVHTEAHDVSWYLEVSWSSGDRSDKIRVDDHGKPFHTSAIKGRPAYEYRLDTNVWDHLDIG